MVTVKQKLCKNIITSTSRNIRFGYLLEWPHWSYSNKYLIYEGIRIKQDISNKTFCSLNILYNNEFILVATSLGISAVYVTRAHCSSRYLDFFFVLWMALWLLMWVFVCFSLRKHAYSYILKFLPQKVKMFR